MITDHLWVGHDSRDIIGGNPHRTIVYYLIWFYETESQRIDTEAAEGIQRCCPIPRPVIQLAPLTSSRFEFEAHEHTQWTLIISNR